MIMRASENRLGWEPLKTVLEELALAISDDNYPQMRKLFTEVVDGYQPESAMVDWIHLHHTLNSPATAQHAG
ncbi:MAG: hypothetical protein GX772_13480 [Alcaligenaceae bacterium]|nr:hypothetical protein [Alcaligenaceae bacterium]